MDRIAGSANANCRFVCTAVATAGRTVWLQMVGSRVPQVAARAKSCGEMVECEVDLLEYIILFLF